MVYINIADKFRIVVNYLISDMINRVKMASLLKLYEVIILNAGVVYFIIQLLKDLGYIKHFFILNFKNIKVYLSYKFNKINIKQFYPISRPSSRVYTSIKSVKGPRINNYTHTVNFTIYSTPQGVISDVECVFLHDAGELLAGIN